MRMAMVEVIGSLIREIAVSADLNADEKQGKKQIKGLYSLLIERTLDLSSYVRTRVLSTMAKLCDLPVKFPKQRLNITKAAVECLEDKSASVRKAAVTLLVKLIFFTVLEKVPGRNSSRHRSLRCVLMIDGRFGNSRGRRRESDF